MNNGVKTHPLPARITKTLMVLKLEEQTPRSTTHQEDSMPLVWFLLMRV